MNGTGHNNKKRPLPGKQNKPNKKRKLSPIVPKAVKLLSEEPKTAAAAPAPAAAASPVAARVHKEKPTKKKHASSSEPAEDPNAPGTPVTLMYVPHPCYPKDPVHTKKLNFTEKHAKLDGHAISQLPTDDSSKKARKFLEWFLAPMTVEDFYNNYWEKRSFVLKRGAAGIRRSKPDESEPVDSDENAYYGGWFSKKIIDRLLRSGELHYSQDVDVTLYQNGRRFTLNPNATDVADADLVWGLHEKMGCSLRVLRPHQYWQPVSTMMAHLEEEFGQGFGANTYLTPAGSQGFAPHWDDVEAFVVQLEGRKQWRIHPTRDQTEILARVSSKNFVPDEITEPSLTVWLEPGDLMYFPRGTIHQAASAPETHSLHLTVSTGHQNTWADLFERVVPQALQQASEENPEFRESLPLHYGNYMGVMHSDHDTDSRRKDFIKRATSMLDKIFNEYVVGQLDDAADQMMTKFLWDRQPPQSMLNHKELGVTFEEMHTLSVGPEAQGKHACADDDHDHDHDHHGHSGSAHSEDMDVEEEGEDGDGDDDIGPDTRVKLTTRDCVRLAIEGEAAALYYATSNEPNYHEVEPKKLELPLECAETVELLWRSYPKYVPASEFPLEDDEARVELCKLLVEKQIVMIE